MSDHQKPSKGHPEARGLFLLAFSAVLFLSFFSYKELQVEKNWLGIAGHYLAFSAHYLFGLSCYFVALFLSWTGLALIIKRKIPSFGSKLFYFLLLLLSTSILLNLYAESSSSLPLLFTERTYREMITLGMHHKVRHNLGGVPAYYLLSDLTTFHLIELLSKVGVLLTFGILGLVSFILLTGIQILTVLRGIYRVFALICFCIAKAFALLKIVFSKSFREDFSPSDVMNSVDSLHGVEEKPPQDPQELIESLPKRRKQPRKFSFGEEEDEEPILLPKKKKRSLGKAARSKPKEIYRGEYEKYQLPPLSLLTSAKKADHPTLKKDLKRQAEILEETLLSFGIEAKVGEINSGPTITSFEVHPAIGVKVQKIKALENDSALNLQAKSIRIIAPIPGKAAVGVEVPSAHPQEVGFKEMLASYQKQGNRHTIPIMLGKTVSGGDVICDLTKMPHCIIAGATGSGKSVCINTLIMSILMNARPDEIKLIMIDPKKVELTPYSPLPHMIAPVITEAHGAYAALSWVVKEMQLRYEILKQLGLRNITSFNSRKIDLALEESLSMEIPTRMPCIVMIIDEFADLMMTSSTDLETPIARIAQMARAVGIHLILATQRPSREVITGLIKANFPTRIAFKVSSRVNSQIILDENGAETLLGNGDMLFLPPGTSQLTRSQGVFVRDEDINQVINFICSQASANYLIKSFDTMSHEELFPERDQSPKDSLYDKALSTVVESKNASTTFLQRKLKIGYARAAGLMDELENRGVIGPQEGSKPRKVLISSSQLFLDT